MKHTNTPIISAEAINKILLAKNIKEPLNLVAIRGFYGENRINTYDDAIFLVSFNCLIGFNANCDPSRYFKKVAILQNGLYKYRFGIHGLSKPVEKQYEALVQASQVTIKRHEEGIENGFFGINIHKGSMNTTSSLGCQTIHPFQWEFFMASVKSKMKEFKLEEINYLLVDGV